MIEAIKNVVIKNEKIYNVVNNYSPTKLLTPLRFWVTARVYAGNKWQHRIKSFSSSSFPLSTEMQLFYCFHVCAFISFHRKGFFWLNKTINVIPEFRSAMAYCGNISVGRAFIVALKTVMERPLKLATVQKNFI